MSARLLVLLGMLLLPLHAEAQTAGGFANGVTLGAGALNTAFAGKQDVTVNLGPGFTGTVAQFLSGQAPITGLAMVAGQGVPVAPVGNTAAPTLGSLVVQGASASSATDHRQFMVTLGMTSATGSGCTMGAQCGNVTLYTGMRQMPGSTDAWAGNILGTAEAGTNAYLQGLELDINNNRGDTPTEAANWIGGLTITGTNAQPSYLNRQAIMVGSGFNRALWHAGLLGDDNSILDALVLDRAGGGSYSYWNRSAHSGATFFDQGLAAISLAAAGTYTYAVIQTENATANTVLAAKPGQTVCFAGVHACGTYTAAGKWTFTDENDVVLFSVAKTTGNAVFKGSVTPNGTP